MLDATDRMIVSLLQQNARISNKDLANAVGIAAATCSERSEDLNRGGNVVLQLGVTGSTATLKSPR